MNKTKITIKTYDAIAEKFDKEYCRSIYFKKQLDNFVSRLKKGSKILDVGSGTGHVARYLCRKGFDVVGVDLSEKMVTLAKAKAPDAIFEVMDIRELKFDQNHFDSAICLFALNHVTHKDAEKVISDLVKLVKKTGLLFLGIPEGCGDEICDEPLDPKHKIYFNYYEKKWILNSIEKNNLKLISIEDRFLRKEGHNEFFVVAKKLK
ncbi:class I SAM-dependent methyltransferase [Candidatus Woesearchaeota archaeon]|jgi:2-polyprenyl-3-methyl-5-hydroxy-6-metoxy-1,4-benzoquinol methylase|nr:class I SAM-dependent methyltransferase [Candidatus Woesearchaeota archaeon]MBT6518694.1 class I SAM-dependent methyltransferase [Candidatus Woesearchaeota archaeon]MBT7368384.1 class I SAM-dependent methyltransferase [Candidatus Woesearchaeota archaeon]